MREPHIPSGHGAAVVRAAMGNERRHAVEHAPVRTRGEIELEDAGDPAHDLAGFAHSLAGEAEATLPAEIEIVDLIDEAIDRRFHLVAPDLVGTALDRVDDEIA